MPVFSIGSSGGLIVGPTENPLCIAKLVGDVDGQTICTLSAGGVPQLTDIVGGGQKLMHGKSGGGQKLMHGKLVVHRLIHVNCGMLQKLIHAKLGGSQKQIGSMLKSTATLK